MTTAAGSARLATLRPVAAGDRDWMLALNNAAVPEVNALDARALDGLLAAAAWARVADIDGRPAGLLIGIGPGAAYASPNYRWFDARADDFCYIDRVIINRAWRGQGLGRAFYADLEAEMTGRCGRLNCEVNAVPPNPASLRFHLASGFAEVGRQATDGGAKQVILMEKALSRRG